MGSGQELRFRFIELLCYWEGQIKVPQIAEQFGLSDNQARTVLADYEKKQPGCLGYDTSLKAKVPTVAFSCQHISNNINEYLHWLQSGSFLENASAMTETLWLPERVISPQVMRGLVWGVRQRRRVDVNYISLSNPNGEGRVIAPHHFVHTGNRWHVRAFCEKSQQFRDFVLSRFRGSSELMDRSAHVAEQDSAWNTLVQVVLAPDPRLSDSKRAVLEQDYQMTQGELRIETRGCLVNYLLRELQISTKTLDVLPEAQQLICKNLPDLKPWLFEG